MLVLEHCADIHRNQSLIVVDTINITSLRVFHPLLQIRLKNP